MSSVYTQISQPTMPCQVPWYEEGRRENDYYLCGLYPYADGCDFRLVLVVLSRLAVALKQNRQRYNHLSLEASDQLLRANQVYTVQTNVLKSCIETEGVSW